MVNLKKGVINMHMMIEWRINRIVLVMLGLVDDDISRLELEIYQLMFLDNE